MALDRHEAAKLQEISEICARLDERTERMDTEIDRRIEGVHARISRVEGDVRKRGALAGLPAGGAAGLFIAYVKDLLSGG